MSHDSHNKKNKNNFSNQNKNNQDIFLSLSQKSRETKLRTLLSKATEVAIKLQLAIAIPRDYREQSIQAGNVIYFCRLVNKNQTWKHLSLEPRGASEMSDFKKKVKIF